MTRHLTLAAALLACGCGDGSSGCLPNETQTCLCPGGGTGMQACDEDGHG